MVFGEYFAEFAESARRAKMEAEDFGKSLNRIAGTSTRGSAGVAQMRKESASLGLQYRLMSEPVENLTEGQRQLREELGHGAEMLAEYRAMFLFAGFGAMFAQRIFEGLSQVLMGLLQTMVQAFTEFEWHIVRTSTLLDATADEYEAVFDEAVRLGQETIYTQTQVAQGMEELARAGFDASEVVGTMGGVADLAATEMAELAEASRIAINVLRGFGLLENEIIPATESMTRVTNIAATAIAESAMELRDFGEAMKYVAPVAQQFGASMESMAAALMATADAGIRAGQAGRHIRNIMLQMAEASGIAAEMDVSRAEALDRLDIQMVDSHGRMKSFLELVQQFEEAMSGWTDQERINTLLAIFNQRQAQSIMRLIDTTDQMERQQNAMVAQTLRQRMVNEGISNWIEKLDEARQTYDEVDFEHMREEWGLGTGEINDLNRVMRMNQEEFDEFVNSVDDARTAGEMARRQIQSLRGQFEQLGASIETLKLGVFEPMAPIVERFTWLAKELVNELGNAPRIIQSLTGSSILLGAVVSEMGNRFFSLLAPLLLVTSSLITMSWRIGTLKTSGNLLIDVFNIWGTVFGIIAKHIGTVIVSMSGLIFTMSALFFITNRVVNLWRDNLFPLQQRLSYWWGELKDAAGDLLNEIFRLMELLIRPFLTALSWTNDTLGITTGLVHGLLFVMQVFEGVIRGLANIMEFVNDIFEEYQFIAAVVASIIGVKLLPLITAFTSVMWANTAAKLANFKATEGVKRAQEGLAAASQFISTVKEKYTAITNANTAAINANTASKKINLGVMKNLKAAVYAAAVAINTHTARVYANSSASALAAARIGILDKMYRMLGFTAGWGAIKQWNWNNAQHASKMLSIAYTGVVNKLTVAKKMLTGAITSATGALTAFNKTVLGIPVIGWILAIISAVISLITYFGWWGDILDYLKDSFKEFEKRIVRGIDLLYMFKKAAMVAIPPLGLLKFAVDQVSAGSGFKELNERMNRAKENMNDLTSSARGTSKGFEQTKSAVDEYSGYSRGSTAKQSSGGSNINIVFNDVTVGSSDDIDKLGNVVEKRIRRIMKREFV